MTENNVVINVRGVQTIDGENDASEITVLGTYLRDKDNGYILEYTELDEDNHENKTVITVGDNSIISVNRFGQFSSEMFFEKNKNHNCRYGTPFGELDMNIHTKRIVTDLCDDGGEINIEYGIDFNMGFKSENVMTITVSQGKVKERN